MMNDKFNRELLNEKVKGDWKVTITKLTDKIIKSDVRYLVSINDGNPIPRYSRSYKSLAAAKRRYNEI